MARRACNRKARVVPLPCLHDRVWLNRYPDMKGGDSTGTREQPTRDYDTRIPTPRKCIKAYCLRHCERDKRINSKRDVVECVVRECPLHPYRTGQLKGRSGPISERTKRNRIARLERARYLVEVAIRDAKIAEKKLQEKKDIVTDYEGRLKKARDKIERRKQEVRKLEILFNDELEAGIWNSKRLDVDDDEGTEEEE